MLKALEKEPRKRQQSTLHLAMELLDALQVAKIDLSAPTCRELKREIYKELKESMV